MSLYVRVILWMCILLSINMSINALWRKWYSQKHLSSGQIGIIIFLTWYVVEKA